MSILGGIGLGLGVVGTLFGASQSYRGAKAQEEMARENARNARIQQAQRARAIRRERQATQGAIIAEAGASGIALTGSALQALQLNAESFAREAGNAKIEGDIAVSQYGSEASAARRRASTAVIGGTLGATGQAFGAAAQLME